MRIKRHGHKNPIPVSHCNHLIYDETKVVDEMAKTLVRCMDLPVPPSFQSAPQEFREKVAQSIDESSRFTEGKAYGHPKVAYFVVHKDGLTTFEFDSDRDYSQQELKQIISLANRAKRRCKFSADAKVQ